jgi:hypothetical protein
MSDIYTGMFKKHVTEHVVKQQQEQQEQQTSRDVVHESSIISAFAKKTKTAINESSINGSALITNLSLIKESIETNPALAIKELDKVIKNLKK